MRGGWARYAIERYSKLKKWRIYAEIVARACREVLGSKCLHVYVVGGAAEDRLTVLSDIDIVIIVPEQKLANLDNIIAIKKKAHEQGLDDEIPIDIKITTEEEFRKLIEKGIYRRTILIK